ncbi:F0F1 ATP synthase subunit A [Longimicrobium sp.]|uniref:F0F1 ATP synthase subunit A n=1 Tax=Longimicrobium sp. TaxID=2029185 RepID=UPI002C5C2D74|nr:F0F1 ATP synthase subunit A [Longimicrobium sp.]HSU16467.1 F0F1 ATP synthase subunit A [Longimicrobium sp.]
MKLKSALIALVLAAAAGPLHAQVPETSVPSRETPEAVRAPQAAEPAPASAGEGHESAEFDPMHHVQDGRTLEFPPFGELELPAAGSWKVGPVDMTPTRHVVFIWLTGLLMLAVFIPAGRAARRRETGRSPGARRHNAVEAAVLFFRDQVVMPNIGHGGEKYAGYLITLFFFILFANLFGLLPWGASATANISVTAALALISFIVVEVSGMVALGPAGYLKTIVYVPHGLPKPLVPIMAVIMTPVELLGKLAKPFALAVRLMANMMAGHIVLLSLFGVALAFGSLAIAVGPMLMALMLTFLELFVAFLQAYVFVVLTSVFIGLIRHEH